MNSSSDNSLKVAVVCKDNIEFRNWRRALTILDKKNVFFKVFSSLNIVIKYPVQYDLIIVLSWLGLYSTEVNEHIEKLPKVIYLCTGHYDKLPSLHPNLHILERGLLNDAGLRHAFQSTGLFK